MKPNLTMAKSIGVLLAAWCAVSCVKTIPETKTVLRKSLTPLPASAITAVVDGEYVLRANVKDMSASISIKIEHFKKYIIDEETKVSFANTRKSWQIEDEVPIYTLVRGYIAMIPLDISGNPITIGAGDMKDTSLICTDVKAYYDWVYRTDVGGLLPLAFHIKLKDKKSLAKLMEEMDNFQLDSSAVEHKWAFGNVEELQNAGWGVYFQPQK